ncbi:MAG: hypothetical protein F6J97_13415 [Leptolyngbya sp. SIO4C1]|nr:hypothetical protein [Leptolyngbya sp. SIO4C1]
MNYHDSGNADFPAPCLIDQGIVINKADMLRLLNDLSRVRYVHEQDGQVSAQGEGYVVEAFAEPQQATLVANHSLYLNVCSFDCLEMGKIEQETYFDLVHDNRRLRLIPLSNPLAEQTTRNLNAAALEAMVTEALSASWDACLDDDSNFSTQD